MIFNFKNCMNKKTMQTSYVCNVKPFNKSVMDINNEIVTFSCPETQRPNYSNRLSRANFDSVWQLFIFNLTLYFWIQKLR